MQKLAQLCYGYLREGSDQFVHRKMNVRDTILSLDKSKDYKI